MKESENTTVCKITGRDKNVHIEYFLEGKSLGKTMVSEGSMSASRIAEAKAINIDFYDQFVLDNGRANSKDCLLSYGGELKPLNDFEKSDEMPNYSLIGNKTCQ